MGLKPAIFSFILPCHGNPSPSSSSSQNYPPPPDDSSPLPSTEPPPPASALHHCVATLHGHSSHVSALLLHSNSLFSASLDHHIRLWSTLTSPATTTTSTIAAASGSAVKSMAISGDAHLITSHYDRRIRVWKLNDMNHPYRLLSILPTPTDRLVSLLSPAKYVQVRRHLRRPWVHHSDVVSAVAVSHDGALLYSASWDRTLKVWRTRDFRCDESVTDAHHDAINAVVAGRDGSVYTGSADATVRVWRRRDGKVSLVATLEKHKSAVNALAVSDDGCVLYSGACDRSVVVWAAAAAGMAAAQVLVGHGGPVLCVAAAAEVVCSGSADKTVRVWRRGRGGRYSCVAVMEGHGGAVKSLAAAPPPPPPAGGGGEYVVYSGSLDCDIKVWKLSVPPREEEED